MSGKACQNVECLPKHSFPLTVDETVHMVQLKYCSITSYKMLTGVAPACNKIERKNMQYMH